MVLRAKRSWGSEGAIEGLPLQLMIVVIVAGIALAVILSWTVAIQTPAVFAEVRTDPASIPIAGFALDEEAKRTLTITVTALDANDVPIPGVVVTLRGAGVVLVAQDGDDGAMDGTVKFSRTTVRLGPQETTATIFVTVEKSGFATPAETSIVVFRG